MGQDGVPGVSLHIYLLDAGSSDGTSSMVRECFPEVNLICRDDSYYWCNGMRLAFGEAMKIGYDYYLWLNDDTILFPNALHAVLETEQAVNKKEKRDCIIVGSTCDSKMSIRTYGGVVCPDKRKPLTFSPVEHSNKPQRCDTFNGNFVLIPRSITRLIGNLSPEYTHAMGDIDYGLRAKVKDVPVWIAPGYVGICNANPKPKWCDKNIPLRKRLRILRSPKGLPPKEWMLFTKRHTGIFWPIHWVKVPLRALFPGFWEMGKKVLRFR